MDHCTEHSVVASYLLLQYLQSLGLLAKSHMNNALQTVSLMFVFKHVFFKFSQQLIISKISVLPFKHGKVDLGVKVFWVELDGFIPKFLGQVFVLSEESSDGPLVQHV